MRKTRILGIGKAPVAAQARGIINLAIEADTA